MALIDESYFRAELNIPDTDKTSVLERLTWFIETHEPELLEALMGYSLYKAYKDGIAAQNPDQKWKDIRDGKEYETPAGHSRKWKGLKFAEGSTKRSVIANYVYYFWLRDLASETTAIGEVSNDVEGGTRVSPMIKQCRAWNEMMLMVEELILFLDSNVATYPEWEKADKSEIRNRFRPINQFNL
jgi:hypothetical protein